LNTDRTAIAKNIAAKMIVMLLMLQFIFYKNINGMSASIFNDLYFIL